MKSADAYAAETAERRIGSAVDAIRSMSRDLAERLRRVRHGATGQARQRGRHRFVAGNRLPDRPDPGAPIIASAPREFVVPVGNRKRPLTDVLFHRFNALRQRLGAGGWDVTEK